MTPSRERPSSTQSSNGVGCAVEPEILPTYLPPDPSVRIGRVEFNRAAIINSPCFWIIVGAGLLGGVLYFINKRD
jgi:hypothetical protein